MDLKSHTGKEAWEIPRQCGNLHARALTLLCSNIASGSGRSRDEPAFCQRARAALIADPSLCLQRWRGATARTKGDSARRVAAKIIRFLHGDWATLFGEAVALQRESAEAFRLQALADEDDRGPKEVVKQQRAS